MVQPPPGYLSVHQAAGWLEAYADDARDNVETRRALRWQAHLRAPGQDAGSVLLAALQGGELRAAGLCDASGALREVPPAFWRAKGGLTGRLALTVSYDWQPVDVPADDGPASRLRIIIAHADLARWAGMHGELPPESGGVRSESHAAAAILASITPARASAGVR